MSNNRQADVKKSRAHFLPLYGLALFLTLGTRTAVAQPDLRAPKLDTPREAPASRRTHWCIVLGTFRGDEQRALASDALALVKKRGIDGAYLEPSGPALVLATGRFSDPASREAREELARVRAIEVDGVRPFAFSFLAPPDQESAMGGKPQYNLLKARDQVGDTVRYTLQVASYGPADLNNPREGELEQARADAEQAAAILRKEGELAFYYHGPRYSMVTIGAWDDKAMGAMDDPADDDPTLVAARKNFPYSLYNGSGVRVKSGSQKQGQLQRSFLVKIPTE